MEIRPVGAQLFHVEGRTDGRTDMTKLRVIIRNFVYAVKKIFSQLETWTTTTENSRPKVS